MRILLIYTTAPDTPGSFRWSALLSILKAEAHQQNGQAPRPCFFVAAPIRTLRKYPVLLQKSNRRRKAGGAYL
jgi:hypothetical protein